MSCSRSAQGGVRYYDMGKSSGSALRICRLSVKPVSPAMTKKMISFVSRNCSKPSVSQRLAS